MFNEGKKYHTSMELPVVERKTEDQKSEDFLNKILKLNSIVAQVETSSTDKLQNLLCSK